MPAGAMTPGDFVLIYNADMNMNSPLPLLGKIVEISGSIGRVTTGLVLSVTPSELKTFPIQAIIMRHEDCQIGPALTRGTEFVMIKREANG